MINLRLKKLYLVASFSSNFEFKFLLHCAVLCCTMYYSIQYSTQVEHTVGGVAAWVSPRSSGECPAIYWHFGHGICR